MHAHSRVRVSTPIRTPHGIRNPSYIAVFIAHQLHAAGNETFGAPWLLKCPWRVLGVIRRLHVTASHPNQAVARVFDSVHSVPLRTECVVDTHTPACTQALYRRRVPVLALVRMLPRTSRVPLAAPRALAFDFAPPLPHCAAPLHLVFSGAFAGAFFENVNDGRFGGGQFSCSSSTSPAGPPRRERALGLRNSFLAAVRWALGAW